MTEKIANIHPGEVLKEEFLDPLNITPYRLARDIDVPPTRIAEIVKGRRGISGDSALRLARYFRTTSQFWMNLQDLYDLEAAERALGAKTLARIQPIPEPPLDAPSGGA